MENARARFQLAEKEAKGNSRLRHRTSSADPVVGGLVLCIKKKKGDKVSYSKIQG